MSNSVFLKSLSLAGYRSFGAKIQRLERFSKVNLFIGQNNSGKSNILRFIHDVYPRMSGKGAGLNEMDRHFPSRPAFVTGIAFPMLKNKQEEYEAFVNEILPKFPENFRQTQVPGYALRIFEKVAEIENSNYLWFDFDAMGALMPNNWEQAFKQLGDDEIYRLWNALTRTEGGDRSHYWYTQSLERLAPSFAIIKVAMIPAIRQVGKKDSVSEEFSGEGIIERLVKLQNPGALHQSDRRKFESINRFLQSVTDNKTAEIEIPHERDTILVHMDGKTLPLESLGTGIHEVIILASAATILDEAVICMEEPELHLNPLLQKKLVRYLMGATTNQYFITTHSAALMDTPGAETYHVRLEDGQSIVERVTSDTHRSAVCEDLGYHPSDLLQANCVIWVEGPSDRIYLNYWIRSLAPQLIEGVHYSIMFYGGRLAAHLTGEDVENLMEDFISLRRLNRRGVIVIDSDRPKKGARINATKSRLKEEFDAGPGHAWITDGREIENYIPSAQLIAAIASVAPSAKRTSKFGQYENTLTINTNAGKASQASKVGVAKYVVKNFSPDMKQLGLGAHVKKLVDFIKASNPGVQVVLQE